MTDSLFIYALGFTAQIFFAARTLLQWMKSERERTVVSTYSYWVLSIMASFLLCLYGWFREDFSIILGQFISYYIYLWNLNCKGLWKRINIILKLILLATPITAAAFVLSDARSFADAFLMNEEVPYGLIIFGSAGQILFTLRFVYQWFYSVKRHDSFLPAGFWIISLAGSALIIAYGIFRCDPVLILGQSFGFVAYTRNLILWHRNHKS